jgi:hypothetical protein
VDSRPKRVEPTGHWPSAALKPSETKRNLPKPDQAFCIPYEESAATALQRRGPQPASQPLGAFLALLFEPRCTQPVPVPPKAVNSKLQ